MSKEPSTLHPLNKCVSWERSTDTVNHTLSFALSQALDNSQSAADLKMQLDKITGRIEELQRLVKEKASAVEQENHKFRRAQV